MPTPQAPDHVGPFYVDGHLAFGEEIDGTEIITFLSMLVEEDNIRLLFRDTSTSSNFPTNDWQAKEGFVAVDATAALARVAELPLLEWSYLGAPGVRHLGPTAEAFHAAFLLGRDERSINPLDLAGVALAAIQGLRSRVVDLTRREEATLSLLRDQERQISSLESDRDLMRRRIESLEQMARGLAAGAAGKPMAAQP